jgi:nitroimidazol reductase NimA-like FMN-containing flavoprotein (pyridoxamine 5'-phosphate oxidase superfamily)
MHGAPVGRTQANIERDARCCFSVSEMGRMLPHETAFGMSVEYAGVIVFGRVSIVEDAAEAQHALEILVEKYFPHLRPGEDYRTITPAELARTAVYRVDIEQWSGKRKEVEPDFPGAFYYDTPVPWRGQPPASGEAAAADTVTA